MGEVDFLRNRLAFLVTKQKIPFTPTSLLVCARVKVVRATRDAMEIVAHKDATMPTQNGHVGELDDSAPKLQKEGSVVQHEIDRSDPCDLFDR